MKQIIVLMILLGGCTTSTFDNSVGSVNTLKEYGKVMKSQGMLIYRLKLIHYLTKKGVDPNYVVKQLDSAYNCVKDLPASEIIKP